jgi:murein DD-endopeptidase MepM/ murein hydrolase activator NlpD
MEENTDSENKQTFTFSKKYLKTAVFPLSIVLTFFLTHLYYSSQMNDLELIHKELKSDLAIQLNTAQKLDDALTLAENHLDSFDISHRSLFNAVIDIEDMPQYEAFTINPLAKPKINGRTIFSELDVRADYITKKLRMQNKFLTTFLGVARDKEAMMESIPAVCPIYVSDFDNISSGFGMRKDPIDSTMKMHKGIDISAGIGTKVYASATGKVVKVISSDKGHGNCIVIEHGYGFRSRYAHLSAFKVKEGDEVKRGDLIGLVGSTGRSTGPHLHYEIEKEGEIIDPKKFIQFDLKGIETY